MNHIPTPDLYTSINNALEERGLPFHVLNADRMWGDNYYIAIKDDSIEDPCKSMWITLSATPDEIAVVHVKRGTCTSYDFDYKYKAYKHPRYFKKYMHIVRIVHEVIQQKHKELNRHA